MAGGTYGFEYKITAKDEGASAVFQKFARQVGDVDGSLGKLAPSLLNVKTGLMAIGGTAAFAAVASQLRASVAEAAAAEQVQVRLAVALQNTGQAHVAAAREINAFAQELMRATGADDEMVTGLVTSAVQMGATVTEAMRLTKVSLDMATQFGSAEAALSQLIRAQNGQVAGLSRLGIATQDAAGKTKDFNTILGELEAKFSGQAAAQLDTYTGKVQALQTAWGNLQQSIGERLIPVLKEAADWWGRVLAKATPAEEKAQRLGRLMEIGRERAYLQTGGGSAVPGINEERIQRLENEERILLAEIKAQAFERRQFEAAQATFTAARPKPVDTEAAKKSAEAAKKLADDQERIRLATLGLYEEPAEYMERMLRDAEALADLMIRWNAPGAFTPRDEIILRQRAAVQGPPEYTITPGVGQGWDTEQFRDALVGGAITSLDETKRLQHEFVVDKYKQEWRLEDESFWRKVAHEEELAAREQAIADARYQASMQFVSVMAAVGRGDYAGAAAMTGQVLSQYTGNANYGYYGQTAANIIGAQGKQQRIGSIGGAAIGSRWGPQGAMLGSTIGSLFGGFMDSSNEPRTQGGIARDAIEDLLEDLGLLGKDIKGRTTRGGTMSVEDFAATGQADIWQSWTNAITGTSAAGEEAARMLAGGFSGLNLSLGETADAVGNLIAKSQGLSQAEGDRAAAEQALLSNSILTADELRELAILYGDSNNYLAQEAAARQKVLDAAQAYANARGTSGEGTADAALQGARADYVHLISSRAIQDKKTEDQLRADIAEAQGITEQEAQEIIDKNAGVEKNTAEMVGLLRIIAGQDIADDDEITHDGSWGTLHRGRMVEGYPSHRYWIRDDEDVVPPEKREGYARRVLFDQTGGYQPRGVTINFGTVYGDKRVLRREVMAAVRDADRYDARAGR